MIELRSFATLYFALLGKAEDQDQEPVLCGFHCHCETYRIRMFGKDWILEIRGNGMICIESANLLSSLRAWELMEHKDSVIPLIERG